MNDSLVVSQLNPGDLEDLTIFFRSIAADPAARTFHPHPFLPEQAVRVCNYRGADLYLGARHNKFLVGYGLLRGWDEGFTIPALGIYLSPLARGRGFGALFMQHLHDQARARGATKVMLKVYPDNIPAISLYKSIGYVFGTSSAGQLVGHIDI